MDFQNLFFVVFTIVIAYLVIQVVKNRGLRGAMFGARVVGTVGELDLGRRGMWATKLKVHRLEPRESGPHVGVEFVATSYGGFSMAPIALNREQASRLAALLSQAVTESTTRTGAG